MKNKIKKKINPLKQRTIRNFTKLKIISQKESKEKGKIKLDNWKIKNSKKSNIKEIKILMYIPTENEK